MNSMRVAWNSGPWMGNLTALRTARIRHSGCNSAVQIPEKTCFPVFLKDGAYRPAATLPDRRAIVLKERAWARFRK